MFTRSIITAFATLLITSPTAFAHDQVVTKDEVGQEIGLCVDRIGSRADYENARRVVHRVGRGPVEGIGCADREPAGGVDGRVDVVGSVG